MKEYKYDKSFDFLLRNLDILKIAHQWDKDIINTYHKKIPNQLITYWNDLGWCGYGNGLYWMVNPKEYDEIIEKWLSGTVFENRDDLSVIARNAFGKIYIWSTGKGEIMNINPATNMISYFPENANRDFSPEDEDEYMRRFWGMSQKEFIDYEDDNDKPLFDRALKKLGMLKTDEVYGFKLPQSLGGSHSLDKLEIM